MAQNTFQKLFLGQLGVEFNKEKHQKCNYSLVLWDITSKFLPVQELIKSQLSTKFEECSLKNDAATPLTISNFSRAWQAYFLSYTLQIWCENTSFKDVQMMCYNDFDTSSGFRFEKIWLSCTVHMCSLYLACLIRWFFNFLSNCSRPVSFWRYFSSPRLMIFNSFSSNCSRPVSFWQISSFRLGFWQKFL